MLRFLSGMLFGIVLGMFVWGDLVYEVGYTNGYHVGKIRAVTIYQEVNHE
jgi:hypothetical protein